MEAKLVTLAVLSFTRAEILKGRLEAKGIESFIVNEHAIRPTFPEDVRVRIREEDVKEALPIALHLKEEYTLPDKEIEMLSEDVKQILVPVDFSPSSYNAFEYAFHIAQKLEAKIKLLHVFYDASLAPIATVDAYHIGFDINLQDLEGKASEQMEVFMKHFEEKLNLSHSGIAIEKDLIGGATEDSILTSAKDEETDLIVMGTQGIGKDSDTFFGSVASTVIEDAEVPVLAIPDTAAFKEIPEPVNVLYATNLETTDYIALRKLMRLLYVFNVKIFCLHVDTEGTHDIDEIRLNSLRDHLQDEYAGYEIECILHVGGDLISSTEKIMEEQSISFVALTTHKKTLFESLFNPSLTRKMLNHSKKPLFVFHA